MPSKIAWTLMLCVALFCAAGLVFAPSAGVRLALGLFLLGLGGLAGLRWGEDSAREYMDALTLANHRLGELNAQLKETNTELMEFLVQQDDEAPEEDPRQIALHAAEDLAKPFVSRNG